MGSSQIVASIIFLTLAMWAFVISYFQFKEKGRPFNNAYFWASQEERKQMDKNKESKKPYYRQSGFVFMLVGLILLIFSVYIVTNWMWIYIVLWAFIIIAVVYAVVSSVQIERRK